MTRDRCMPGGSVPVGWPPKVAPATLDERRAMKKAAQPEHSYTGHVPQWLQEPEDAAPEQQRKRNAPILGYSGHLRHREDRIGTTFTKSVEVSRRPQPAHAGPLTKHPAGNNNQPPAQSPLKKQVKFQGAKATMSKASGYGAFDAASGYGAFQAKPMSAGSGYGAFDNASGYGQFQGRPKSSQSGYGEFDNASGYGQFQARPKSTGSGYGAFDGASGYGEFQAKPMSPRSGYGAFESASGYGEFAARPKMSARSAYGEFDAGSGYGDFQAKPMSPRSGYGAFDAASRYGDFLAGPTRKQEMSPRSGYGEFDAASGYGDFVEKPEADEDADDASQGYGDFAGSVQYGDFMSPRSGYGAFDGASGYGAFMEPPALLDANTSTAVARKPIVVKHNEEMDRKYQHALRAVGGEAGVLRLLDAFATTISQRHVKRTELLQALKRHFEKHERENRGQMSKAHVKEALLGLSCVFTDDQLTALMGKYDPECKGSVPMDELLTALSTRATK